MVFTVQLYNLYNGLELLSKNWSRSRANVSAPAPAKYSGSETLVEKH